MEKGKKPSCLALILFLLFFGIQIVHDHQTKVPIIGSDVDLLKQEFPLVGKYKERFEDKENEIWICYDDIPIRLYANKDNMVYEATAYYIPKDYDANELVEAMMPCHTDKWVELKKGSVSYDDLQAGRTDNVDALEGQSIDFDTPSGKNDKKEYSLYSKELKSVNSAFIGSVFITVQKSVHYTGAKRKVYLMNINAGIKKEALKQ
ncbi:hypothetical protein [Anaerovibrio sp.]|uniref:hypothetical protein n=1 Tax=Anaerovibrio sp. TaxID=1872532 RepID=UPI003F165E0F